VLITSPLTELLKKDVKFEWTEKCQDALNKIKDMLMKHPILRFPDPTRRYYLQTDYSGEGISAVLSQLFEDGEHPTAYWSKANRGAQKKYPSTQGECYAVVQGMKHFRKTKGDTAQMFRWSLIIQEYMPFDIAWREGRKHGNSDMCSRFPIRNTEDVLLTETVFDMYSLSGRDKIIKMQLHDDLLVKCRNYLTKYELPEHPMERRYILAICKNIFLEDNCLMYGGNLKKNGQHDKTTAYGKLVVPTELIPKVLKLIHEDARHFGPAKHYHY
jgi:hypothetical protein